MESLGYIDGRAGFNSLVWTEGEERGSGMEGGDIAGRGMSGWVVGVS